MDLQRLFSQAVAQQNSGKWAEAERLYRAILAVQEGLAPVHWNLGVVLKAQDRFADALEQFTRVGGLDPAWRGLHFNRGLCLQKLGRTAEAAEAFALAVEAEPEDATTRYNLAAAWRELGRLPDAVTQAEAALMLRPDLLDAHLLLAKLRTAMLPLWHVPMMNDTARNGAYARAIAATVKPGDVVLEIGTGSGLLAMLAARAGAARVVTCEAVPWIAEAARRIIALNGLSDRITVVDGHSTLLEAGGDILPERADVVLSEIIASDFLSEGVLESLRDAKARLAKPGARIIPQRGGIRAALVGGDRLEQHLFVDRIEGLDLSPFNALFPRVARVDPKATEPRLLSDPVNPFIWDFQGEIVVETVRGSFPITAKLAGRCLGVIQWIVLDFGHDIIFQNDPISAGISGWQPGVYLAEAPFPVQPGETVTINVFHDGFNVWLGPDR